MLSHSISTEISGSEWKESICDHENKNRYIDCSEVNGTFVGKLRTCEKGKVFNLGRQMSRVHKVCVDAESAMDMRCPNWIGVRIGIVKNEEIGELSE